MNWEIKYIFLRHDADMLVPLSLAAFGVMVLRAVAMFLGRDVDQLAGREDAWPPPSATCSPA